MGVLVVIMVIYEFVIRPGIVQQVFEEPKSQVSQVDERTSRILGIFKRYRFVLLRQFVSSTLVLHGRPEVQRRGKPRRKVLETAVRTAKDDAIFQVRM